MVNFWRGLSKPFFVLAPMEDVTDFVFREIVAEIARPDVFFTEFTSADGLISNGYEATVQRLKYSENQRPIVAQIWGTNPESLYKAAKLVTELKFDGIDINMGCPADTVVKRGAGAALIKNHNLTKEIIDAVKNGANGLPVSIKTRIGFDRIVTGRWISFLLEQKIDALTVHGRIALQMSREEANWKEISHAVLIRNVVSPETILIGNGDITSYSQALEAHKEYGIDGVMIGRGIFHNPWVFEKTQEVNLRDKKDRIELLMKHLKLFIKTWGDGKNFEVMKKFFKIYIKDFDGANQLRQSLMETKNISQVEKLLRNENI